MAKLKLQQDRAIRRMKGLIIISDSSSGDDDRHGSGSDDPPPTANAYSCVGDQKGKGTARKW